MSSRKTRPVYKGNRNGMILISLVVVVLIIALTVRCRALISKNEAFAQQIELLQQKMTEEADRSVSIEEYRAYTQSDAYIEKAAREKLGLVYPDEVIFKPAS